MLSLPSCRESFLLKSHCGLKRSILSPNSGCSQCPFKAKLPSAIRVQASALIPGPAAALGRHRTASGRRDGGSSAPAALAVVAFSPQLPLQPSIGSGRGVSWSLRNWTDPEVNYLSLPPGVNSFFIQNPNTSIFPDFTWFCGYKLDPQRPFPPHPLNVFQPSLLPPPYLFHLVLRIQSGSPQVPHCVPSVQPSPWLSLWIPALQHQPLRPPPLDCH